MMKQTQAFVSLILALGLGVFLWIFVYKKYTGESILTDRLVHIVATQKDQTEQRWVGYKISENMILTALHIIDGGVYLWADGKKVFVKNIDPDHDLAVVSEAPWWDDKNSEILLSDGVNIGDDVVAFVWRDGRWQKVTGKVTGLREYRTAIRENGDFRQLFVPVVTDIVFQKGESGAPIFDTKWRVVDVVHTE